ncbi:MAG: Translation initiation factor [Phycisphaerales bacterium]|nr:Translation initiation factor [Phycisphaerales bacterium]
MTPCGPRFFGVPAIATDFRYNERIRISPVRLIDDKDEMLGIVPTAEALRLAREAGLDLVEVAPNARPPVCKILDFGKWKYQQQKKEAKSHGHSKGGQLKEIKFRTVRIGDHDLEIKTNHARSFLSEGNKVQFTLQFRGRELAHTELGYAIFTKVREWLYAVSKVERPAKMEGKRMTMVLQPDHKPAGKDTPPPPQAKPIGGTGNGTGGGNFARPAVSGQGLNLNQNAGSNDGPPPSPNRFAPVGTNHGTPARAPAAPAAAPAAPAAPRPVPEPVGSSS